MDEGVRRNRRPVAPGPEIRCWTLFDLPVSISIHTQNLRLLSTESFDSIEVVDLSHVTNVK